jgi:hypothetical protein
MSDEALVRGVMSRSRARTKPSRGRTVADAPIRERRRTPRPRLAEIRVGARFNLLPPIVVTGAVRMIEFLLLAALGFAIYLGYVEREGQSMHVVYLVAVLTAALANSVPALNAFVRSFTRIAAAWTVVMFGLMAGAFLGKVGADFSRVWIATWYLSALFVVRAVRRAARGIATRQALDPARASQPPRSDRRRRPGGRGSDQGARSVVRYRHPHRRHLR